jgi:hypothetical protein
MNPPNLKSIKAQYAPRENPSDTPNPLWEAIPPNPGNAAILEAMSDTSDFFNVSWRSMSAAYRLNRLTYMQEYFFVPRPCHVRLVNNIYQTLFSQYASMGDVFSNGYYIPGKGVNEESSCGMQCFARNFGLFGDSGSGKSRAVERALALFPSLIRHNDYFGQEFIMTQAPIIHVTCPKSGDLQMAMAILTAIKERLNSPYRTPKNAKDAGELIIQKVRMGGIALIVLNEFDAVIEGNKTSDTLQFLTGLAEDKGISFLKVGTSLAFERMKGTPHAARRASGYAPWKKMEKNADWKDWLRKVLNLGLLQNPLHYSEELSEYFYWFSQGLTEAVIELFINLQRRALYDGRETILSRDFNGIESAEMAIMAPTLRKFRRDAENRKANAAKKQGLVYKQKQTMPPPADPVLDVQAVLRVAAEDQQKKAA